MRRAIKLLVAWIDRDWENVGYSAAGSLLQPLMWIAPIMFAVLLFGIFDTAIDDQLMVAGLVISCLMGIALVILSYSRLYIGQSKRERDKQNGN